MNSSNVIKEKTLFLKFLHHSIKNKKIPSNNGKHQQQTTTTKTTTTKTSTGFEESTTVRLIHLYTVADRRKGGM